MQIFFGNKTCKNCQSLLAILTPITFCLGNVTPARSQEIPKLQNESLLRSADETDFRNRASFMADDLDSSLPNPIPEQRELDALPGLPPATSPPPRLSPQIPPAPDTTMPLGTRIKLRRIEVVGSRVFSPSELSRITSAFLNKTLTFEQLLSIRAAVTNFYTSRGYETSGAFIPPQDITNGTLKVQVIEGQLERIEIKGLKRLQNRYVRSRLKEATQTPLDLRQLESALQLLQQSDLIERVQARMTPGIAPGRSVLTLDLKETAPFGARLSFDNRESPSVGSLGGYTNFNYDNLLGIGDRIGAGVALTEGVTSYDFNYAIPVNSRDGKFILRYATGRNRVVEAPFAPLDINGKSRTYSLGFSQPLFRSPTSEFSLGLSLDLRRSRTFLFEDKPFTFTPGPEQGESKATILRFSQNLAQQSRHHLFAARSQFSFGIDAFGATTNDSGRDGRFFSWLGQFQLVRALNQKRDATFVVRGAAQLTRDALLPLEQLSIGGIDTVRGYRSNERVGDNGIAGTLEFQLPIARDTGGFGLLQVIPFLDAGVSWTNGEPATPSPNLLVSTGLGLRWTLNPRFAARADWGIPLVPVEDQGETLQDNGLSFSIEWQPF